MAVRGTPPPPEQFKFLKIFIIKLPKIASNLPGKLK